MIDSRFYDRTGPFSLGDLLDGLDVGPLPGDGYMDEEIRMPADLATAQAGEISFLSHRKFKSALETSSATACFVTEKLATDLASRHIIPIISKYPRAHFARIVQKLVKKRELGTSEAAYQAAPTARIHNSAVIGDGAVIEDKAYIGPHCIIGPGVRIGAGSVLEGHNMIECADIGADCQIKSGAQIGGEGFGMDGDEKGIVNLPHVGCAIVGDRVRIGSHSCVDRGFLGDTTIGDDVKIDNLVQIAHNCSIGAGTMIAGRVGISGSCKIGKNVRMGGAVGLADHLEIGDNAQIAASSGLMKDVPAGEYWGGTPATPIREQMKIIAATRKLIEKKS